MSGAELAVSSESASHSPEEFDGVKVYRQIHELIALLDHTGRIVLDFSEIGPIKTVELYRFLAQLTTDPYLANVEIVWTGLRVSGRTHTREEQRAHCFARG